MGQPPNQQQFVPDNPNYGIGGYGSGLYGNAPIENLPLGYYLGLLTSQYQPPSSPKTNAFLRFILQKFDDASQCLVQLDTAFDVNYAIGVQLDQLGTIVGASRTVGFQPSNGVSPVLDDNTYRTLILATIARNQWDGTIDGLQAIWQQLFPTLSIVIIDNQNMTATILIKGTLSSILKDLITNGYIVPRPETVLYNYTFPTLPAFGFDQDSAYVAGFDIGHWS